MKVVAFSVRPDEVRFFEEYADKLDLDVKIISEHPTPETLHLAEGADALSIITTPITGDMVKTLSDMGIKYISTRTVGFDHIDTQSCDMMQIEYGNVTYSTSTVAEYAVMLMIMGLRKLPSSIELAKVQDYSISEDKMGKEIRNCTVGVVGTGRIGKRVIEILTGFGANVIAYDVRPSLENVNYVSLDDLYKNSDVITFHIPMNPDDGHMVNKEAFDKMKKGVVLVNTARGAIIDTYALIDAAESGKIGFALLDVIEDEKLLYYYDLRNKPISNRGLHLLNGYRNILVTPHLAFYTVEAVSEMVLHSLEWIKSRSK